MVADTPSAGQLVEAAFDLHRVLLCDARPREPGGPTYKRPGVSR
jgi:hypothetical protein